MKVKNIDLLKCVQAMKYLCEKENILFKTAVSISKNASSIDSALEEYLASRNKLDNEHLTAEDNTQKIKIGSEEIYLKALTELNCLEADIQIEKISPNELANISFPPKYIESIAFMLDI